MTDKLRTAFDEVKASSELKAGTLRYLEAQREKRQPRRYVWRGALAAVCALLLLFGAWQFLRIPVSYVSIDVNPSVELALNRLDRIISARAYNDDGALVLSGLPLRGKLYTEAIEMLLDSSAMSPYLNEDPALTFTVAAADPEKESAMLTAIENTHCCRRYGGESCGADLSSLLEAHSHGLSFGKYAAYQALAEYESTVTPEDCHSMTMGEIHQRIRQHQHGHHSSAEPAVESTAPGETPSVAVPAPVITPVPQEHHNGNGSGNGNGNGMGNGECKNEEPAEAGEDCASDDHETEPEPEPAGDCSGGGNGNGSGNGNGGGHHGSGHHGE